MEIPSQLSFSDITKEGRGSWERGTWESLLRGVGFLLVGWNILELVSDDGRIRL